MTDETKLVRNYLRSIAAEAPVTYQTAAQAVGLTPPNTIHQLTVILETLMEEDANAQRPLISALVISKARGGLPAPGFFDCAARVGRFDGSDPAAFYTDEFQAAVDYWSSNPPVPA